MAPGKKFAGTSTDNKELKAHPELELAYITAVPRMALYMKYSTEIYNIYLKYVAPEDIHVYSIDEVFMDVTDYLNTYRMTARSWLGNHSGNPAGDVDCGNCRNRNKSVPV